MPRWEAQRWLLHPDQDGRELVSCVSDASRERAEDEALGYAAALEKQGYTLGPGKPGEIWATKGATTYAIRVEERARWPSGAWRTRRRIRRNVTTRETRPCISCNPSSEPGPSTTTPPAPSNTASSIASRNQPSVFESEGSHAALAAVVT